MSFDPTTNNIHYKPNLLVWRKLYSEKVKQHLLCNTSSNNSLTSDLDR